MGKNFELLYLICNTKIYDPFLLQDSSLSDGFCVLENSAHSLQSCSLNSHTINGIAIDIDSTDIDKIDPLGAVKNTKPAQKATEQNIHDLGKRIIAWSAVCDTLPSQDVDKKLRIAKEDSQSAQQNLKRTKQIAEAQKKFRDVKKANLEVVVKAILEAFEWLKSGFSVGRPALEEDVVTLHKVILEIAMFGSAADDRRHTNVIKSVNTLDDLHQELENQGLTLSRYIFFVYFQGVERF